MSLSSAEALHNVNHHYGVNAEDILLTLGVVIATTGVDNAYLRGGIAVVSATELDVVVVAG